MRKSILGLAVMAGFAATFFAGAAAANPYKWCANYSGGRGGGGTNCGFVTLGQCRAAISGVGGVCNFNPYYTAERPVRRAHRYYRD
jgi:hypothetical protein